MRAKTASQNREKPPVTFIEKKQRRKNVLKEFKEFAMRGNVMDMAVGVIVGAAFGKIVSSLVEDVMMRSEEHTSELQSRLHLVCRLLLEKKKNTYSVVSVVSMSSMT